MSKKAPTKPTENARDRRRITVLPIDALVPYARNARTHSDAQVAQIAASIREFGWTNPVLIDEDGGIIAGHGRVLAARQLGQTEVPCITLTGLTKTQRRAYVLADNKLALNAGWDDEMLRLELADLKAEGFDLALTGFDGADLAGLLDVSTTLDAGSVLGDAIFSVVVECTDEVAQAALLEQLESEGFKCRLLMS